MSCYDWQKNIIEKHPRLYCCCKFFDCGPGWATLLEELSIQLSQKIEEAHDKDQEYLYATKVKEKWGFLCYQMGYSTNTMEAVIREYEDKSANICELCGESGKVRSKNGWCMARCLKCFKEK